MMPRLRMVVAMSLFGCGGKRGPENNGGAGKLPAPPFIPTFC
jgi:hypothetical protein